MFDKQTQNTFYLIIVLILCGILSSIVVDKYKHIMPAVTIALPITVVSNSKTSDESDILLNVWLKKMNLQIYSSDKRKTNTDLSFTYTVVVKPTCVIPPCADSIGIIKIECDTLSKTCTVL